jgi:hypothetical protein
MQGNPHVDAAGTYWSPGAAERPRGRLRRRILGGELAVLYVLLLAAFSLPWLTVSCDSTQTKALSGYDLAFRADPEIRDPEIRGSLEPQTVERIMDPVTGFRRIAAVLLALTLLSMAAALGVAFTATNPHGLMIFLATMTAQGFVALLFGRDDATNAHHHFGLGVAIAIATLAALLALPLGATERRQPMGRKRDVASWCALGAALVLGLGIVQVMLDARLEGDAVGFLVLLGALPAWLLSAVLTVRDVTVRSGIGLMVAGVPLSALGGSLLSG